MSEVFWVESEFEVILFLDLLSKLIWVIVWCVLVGMFELGLSLSSLFSLLGESVFSLLSDGRCDVSVLIDGLLVDVVVVLVGKG